MNRVQELAEELMALRQQGRRATVHVTSVDEAIALAARLRDLGKAQWFRGQVQNWPKLTPSFYRRSEAESVQAREAIQRFGNWVQSTPGLEEIAASTDAKIAVAQHYGMPTTFLDFTTEPHVAGYFASVSKKPPDPGTESCIYCLDIEEADTIWQYIPGDRHPERLVLDVPNLWRLEAQKGVFVYCPFDDLNGPYPIDRIVFPYQGPVSAPSDAEIYPERESVLEALLREYFQAEQIMKGSVVFDEIVRHTFKTILTIEGQPFIAKHFSAPPTAHSSWNSAQLKKWLEVEREEWSDVQRAPELSLEINLNGPTNENAAQFGNFIRSHLRDEPTLRRSMLVWKVGIKRRHDPTIDRLNTMIQRVWDEMTRLPWTDEEIACSLSSMLKCFLTAEMLREDQGLDGMVLERETARLIFPRPLRVELGGRGNIHTWAWVDEGDLLGAVRPDFESLLRPESRHRILGDTFNTLMVARSPSLLFDFGKLSALFAEQIIPTQVVFYPDHPLFPTPARVQVIGPE